MNNPSIFYVFSDVCDESVYELEDPDWVGDSIDKSWLAQDAAGDYYNRHDGWELDSWPQTVELYRDEDKEDLIGVFSVDREFSPDFSASEVAR